MMKPKKKQDEKCVILMKRFNDIASGFNNAPYTKSLYREGRVNISTAKIFSVKEARKLIRVTVRGDKNKYGESSAKDYQIYILKEEKVEVKNEKPESKEA